MTSLICEAWNGGDQGMEVGGERVIVGQSTNFQL